jgi:hypothetical protein
LVDEDQVVPSSTALHLAYNQKNARSIKIILTYLGKLQNTSSEVYSDIMPNLIEYNGFADYLWGLTFTTTQMENKQALRVISPYSSTIVSLEKSKISYIDNHYFMTKIKHKVVFEGVYEFVERAEREREKQRYTYIQV